MDYGSYLGLDALLSAQHPMSDPPHHDELLFIIQHQTTELWLKLVVHELRAVRRYLDTDDLSRALKGLARVKHIQRTITEQWSVLATLTPSEYAEFRGSLGQSSGFQSHQYRAVEFLLGQQERRDAPGLPGQARGARACWRCCWRSPPCTTRSCACWLGAGMPVPAEILDRDVTQAWTEHPELTAVFKTIYEDPHAHWELYEACEDLVDIEDAFQLWRFRHLRTVQRTIGFKTGTGGSSGVGFLKRALDLTFFPELISVRTEIDGPLGA